jgi:hypothetical protein
VLNNVGEPVGGVLVFLDDVDVGPGQERMLRTPARATPRERPKPDGAQGDRMWTRKRPPLLPARLRAAEEVSAMFS